MKNFNVRWRVGLLLLCYIFFFTSRWTMKGVLAGKEYRSTEVGVPYALSENISVNVLSWTWAEDQGLMEVELEIINVREDLNRELTIESGYRESPDTRRRKPLTNRMILDEGIYKVLWIQIDKGTVFSEVVLKLIDPDGNSLSLYTNIDIITRVDRIEKLTAEQYIRRRYEAELEDCRRMIEECEAQIQEKRQLIENLETINEELSSMHYSSPEEMQRTEDLINENRTKQENYRREIEDLQKRMTELQDRAAELQEKIDSFR